jgi:hypothetical protein
VKSNQPKMEKVGKCPQCGAPIYAPEWSGFGDPPENRYTCVCRLNAKATYHYHYEQPQYVPYFQPYVMPTQPTLPYEPTWTGSSGICNCKQGG